MLDTSNHVRAARPERTSCCLHIESQPLSKAIQRETMDLIPQAMPDHMKTLLAQPPRRLTRKTDYKSPGWRQGAENLNFG